MRDASTETAVGSAGAAPVDGADGERRWLRPAALFAVTLALSPLEPVVLVGVPYLLLVLVLPARRLGAVLLGGLVAFLALGGGPREGMWYLERGWAILLSGWFIALTLGFPASGFTPRALGAVGGAAAVAAVLFAWAPHGWTVLNWLITDRMRSGVAGALEALQRMRGGEGAVPPQLTETVYRTVEVQAQIFPAMIALASLAALGVAWWLYVRLAHESGRGLGPMREFRFNDHLVWLFIVGLLMVVVGVGGGWSRAGSNAVVFMALLYALRGGAVVVFFNGGVSLLGAAVLLMGLLFVAPVMLVGALLIGLGDTWLDLRERARRLTT